MCSIMERGKNFKRLRWLKLKMKKQRSRRIETPTTVETLVLRLQNKIINHTVSRHIKYVSVSVEKQLIHHLGLCSENALQMDESADTAGLAVLLLFVPYPFDKSSEEDLL